MAGWYRKVADSLDNLPDCMDYFTTELEWAKKNDLSLKGARLERLSAELPGVVEQRYNQLQEIEAILEYLNVDLRRIRSDKFRLFLEKHQRALSSRDAEKYVDGDRDVVNMAVLINEFALLRNQWHGLMKAIETKNFQVNNIVKLRVAGLDDATVH